ncbi:hypothetical protein D3C81_1742090 [compost metagenome]
MRQVLVPSMAENSGQALSSARSSRSSRNMISWEREPSSRSTAAIAPQYWPLAMWLTQGSEPLTL